MCSGFLHHISSEGHIGVERLVLLPYDQKITSLLGLIPWASITGVPNLRFGGRGGSVGHLIPGRSEKNVLTTSTCTGCPPSISIVSIHTTLKNTFALGDMEWKSYHFQNQNVPAVNFIPKVFMI